MPALTLRDKIVGACFGALVVIGVALMLAPFPSVEAGVIITTFPISMQTDVATKRVDVAREEYLSVWNNTGGSISRTVPVYVTGRDSTTNLFTVAAADADALSTTRVIGLIDSDCANGTKCIALITGRIDDVDTSAFSTGAALYLSGTAGALTATKPVPPAFAVSLATVGTSNASVGWLQVNVRQPVQELETLISFNNTGVNNVQTYGGMNLLYGFTVVEVTFLVTAIAGAGTNNVIRISDGTNNCDVTFSCTTELNTTGVKTKAPSGTCTFATGADLTFSETTAGCTPDPTIRSLSIRGIEP